MVYWWLVEKAVGQWQSTVCCGVQVVGVEGGGSVAVHSVLWCTGGWLVEKVVGQLQSTVCCGVQVVG